jgi:hypothetical protein
VSIPLPPKLSDDQYSDFTHTESRSTTSALSCDESDSDMSFEPSVAKKKERGRKKNSKNIYSSKKDKNPRKDVVLKTILRKMRKFFIQEFNKSTKFITRKRTHKANLY